MRRNRRPYCLFSMTLLVVVLSGGFGVHAQTPPAPSPTPIASPTPSLEKEFFKNVLRDQKAIWTAPFHLQREDAKWIVPSGIGVMALITTDRITGDEIAEFDRQVKASRIVSYAGSAYGIAAVAGTFYIVGRKTNNSRARETGVLSAQAAVNSLIVSTALKGITQRGRPQSGRDRSEFFDGGSSFPSGHSIEAWSVATIIAHEYHERRLVQVAAYGIAAAVSVSRFTGHKHYLSDVLVGSALGYGIGQYVYHTHHRKTSASSDDDAGLEASRWPAITPRYNRRVHSYGVALSWSF
jgi:membrane-associated phospholipid phosphatase